MKTLLHCFLRGQDLLVKIPLATYSVYAIRNVGTSRHIAARLVMVCQSLFWNATASHGAFCWELLTYFKCIRKFNLTTWFSFQNTSLKIL